MTTPEATGLRDHLESIETSLSDALAAARAEGYREGVRRGHDAGWDARGAFDASGARRVEIVVSGEVDFCLADMGEGNHCLRGAGHEGRCS